MTGLTFVDWQEPIGCGGVAVFPNDVIMVDDDGAVVIPAELLADVAAGAAEQERHGRLDHEPGGCRRRCPACIRRTRRTRPATRRGYKAR